MYGFDVGIIKSALALVDSGSIPRRDSRLLIASRDPPIGTPVQEVGGSSTLALDILLSKGPLRLFCIPGVIAALDFLAVSGFIVSVQ